MDSTFGVYMSYESRVLLMGLPRYGKTRLIRDRLTADASRVLWHDVTGHDYFAQGRIPLSIDELEANLWLLEAPYCRVIVIAKTAGDPDSLSDEVERIIDAAYSVGGNMILAFDEVQAHARKTDKVLNNLFARGNHHNIAPIIAAQNATDLPLGARKTCSDAYCFGQHHPKELQQIYDCYGDLFAARVANLSKGDNPVHWRESDREKWWSVQARNKFRRDEAAD